MSINPFESIDVRLSKIESILKDLKTKPKSTSNKNLTVAEVAIKINVSKQSVWNYIKKGIIPATQVGRKYLIKEQDLETIITEVKSLKYKRDVEFFRFKSHKRFTIKFYRNWRGEGIPV